MKTKRELSAEEKLRTERLKKIWLEKKKELNLTQEKAGLECGWNGQSAFSQYLGGHAAITLQIAVKLAKVLKVEPTEIMPEIANLMPRQTIAEETKAIYKSGLKDKTIEIAKKLENLTPEQQALIEQTINMFKSTNQKSDQQAA